MQSRFSQNLEQDLERICVKKLTRSCNNLVSRIPARILPRILEEIQDRNFDEKSGGDLGEILGGKSCQERKKIWMEIVLGISLRFSVTQAWMLKEILDGIL